MTQSLAVRSEVERLAESEAERADNAGGDNGNAAGCFFRLWR